MNRFSVKELPLAGLRRVERHRFTDERGFLSRLFCVKELELVGWSSPIVQINHTYTSTRGTVRGMHFQNPPMTEIKLVICLKGVVQDVAVDVRRNSNTFLGWHSEVLSAENGFSLLIPEGFAHGFQSLTDDVEMLYFHSKEYSDQLERGLRPTDPDVGIVWTLPISNISQRDSSHKLIVQGFQGVVF